MEVTIKYLRILVESTKSIYYTAGYFDGQLKNEPLFNKKGIDEFNILVQRAKELRKESKKE